MTWELILDGYSESSYSATPRFAAARLPWFTAADKKAMTHAAYAQCFFILAQVMAFPSLGVAGAMVAALCGMMPWLTKFAKEAPSKAFGMVMASLCLAPVYGKLCELVVHAIQGA
ncbi:hypothetical protein ACPB0R_22565 [Escherichia coli]